jgi:ketosteroid isomerase-like protein
MFASRSRGDRDWLELISPDFVLDYSRRQIDPFVSRAADPEARARYRDLVATFERPPQMEPLELIDAGDKILAFLRVSGRSRTSGVEVDVRVWHLVEFRDDVPVTETYYGEDRAAAFAAIGRDEPEAA